MEFKKAHTDICTVGIRHWSSADFKLKTSLRCKKEHGLTTLSLAKYGTIVIGDGDLPSRLDVIVYGNKFVYGEVRFSNTGNRDNRVASEEDFDLCKFLSGLTAGLLDQL